MPKNETSLREIAISFLKLGTIAFGGPASHIAMMEEEFVRRHRWISREKFLDLLGAASLIPGPRSTELAIYIGFLQAGWIGLMLAGVCFILPAAAIVTLLAWLYVQFGSLPQAVGILYGIKPVVVAIILQALCLLGRSALKTKLLTILGIFAFAVSFVGINPLTIIIAAGFIAALLEWLKPLRNSQRPNVSSLVCLVLVLPLAFVVQAVATWMVAVPASLDIFELFLIFLKIGSVVFGSGYVLLAFLHNDLVTNLHWLNDSQLLTAVIVGQVTPGPVFTTATFIGYLLLGLSGAVVATVGIFLPAFILVAVSGPLIPRIRRSLVSGAFLDGVIITSLALMAYVTYLLGLSAIIDLPTALLAVVSSLLLIRFHVNSAWLILAGAMLGLVVPNLSVFNPF